MQKRSLLIIVIFIFSLAFSLFAQSKNALSLADVLTVLRSNKVTLAERNKLLTEGVKTRGISFSLTTEIETELVKTGANPALIDAIRTKSLNSAKTNNEVKSNSSNSTAKLKLVVLSEGETSDLNGIKKGISYYSDYLSTPKIAANEKALAHKLRAELFSQNGEYDLAVSDYTEALRINSNDASAWYERGFIYLNNLENYDSAISDFNSSVKLAPRNAQAFLWLGKAFYQKGNFQEAVQNYNKAEQMSSDTISLIYELRATAYEKLGMKDLAENDRKKAKLF